MNKEKKKLAQYFCKRSKRIDTCSSRWNFQWKC